MNTLRSRLALVAGLCVFLFGTVAYAAFPTILAVGATSHPELIGGTATLTALYLVAPGEVGA